MFRAGLCSLSIPPKACKGVRLWKSPAVSHCHLVLFVQDSEGVFRGEGGAAVLNV